MRVEAVSQVGRKSVGGDAPRGGVRGSGYRVQPSTLNPQPSTLNPEP